MAAVALILTPGQSARLKQIDLRLQVPAAFREPDVVARLKLAGEQRDRIRATRRTCSFPRPSPRGPASARCARASRPDLAARWKAANDGILAVLNDAQKKQWAAMTGEPFTGRIFPGPPHRR